MPEIEVVYAPSKYDGIEIQRRFYRWKFSNEELRGYCDDYKNHRKTIRQIAKEIHFNQSTLSKVMKAFDPELVVKRGPIKGRFASPKIYRNKMFVFLRQQGKTYEEIGREYKITGERVRQILKKQNPELLGHYFIIPKVYCLACKKKISQARIKPDGRCQECYRVTFRAEKLSNWLLKYKTRYDDLTSMRNNGLVWEAIAYKLWGDKLLKHKNPATCATYFKRIYEIKAEELKKELAKIEQHEKEKTNG